MILHRCSWLDLCDHETGLPSRARGNIAVVNLSGERDASLRTGIGSVLLPGRDRSAFATRVALARSGGFRQCATLGIGGRCDRHRNAGHMGIPRWVNAIALKGDAPPIVAPSVFRQTYVVPRGIVALGATHHSMSRGALPSSV